MLLPYENFSKNSKSSHLQFSFFYTISNFYFLWLSMNKQIRKNMLQLAIEPMTRTGLHDQCSNHWAIEAQSTHKLFFSEWYFIIERIFFVDTTCAAHLEITKLFLTKWRWCWIILLLSRVNTTIQRSEKEYM